MVQIVNGPDGCRRNRSKLTVYPVIQQSQPSTGIKGNSWIFHLDLDNKKKRQNTFPHTNGTIWPPFLPGIGLNPAFREINLHRHFPVGSRNV